mgnify:CR=1 FL=1
MNLYYFKIFANVSIYFLSILLILLTYKNIVPEKDIIKIKQETKVLWLDINDVDGVGQNFEIQNLNKIEKAEYKSKDRTKLVEHKKQLNTKKNIEEKKYKLQFLSIKKKKFSEKIKKQIQKEYTKFNVGILIFEEANIPSLGKFIRVQTKRNFIKEKARKICREIIKVEKKCMILQS